MTKGTGSPNGAYAASTSGYALVNGLNMYYEIHGAGEPLILLHGGLGLTSMFGDLLPALAADRQVIAVDLQAHGRTADIDRPLSYELMGDDIAALIVHLGLAEADLMGYSLGGGVALRTAIQHPKLVRKLVSVSTPFSQDGWYPEIVASMAQMSGAAAEFMKESPMYREYTRVAPRPEDFPVLLDKIGDMLRHRYDWSDDVAALKMPTLLVFGDADSIPPPYCARFFELLGGGKTDGGWDGSGMSSARLAILPGTTHYNIFSSPLLVSIVRPFLDASPPAMRRWGE
jgi:pimeloyl-ACP methyl ester carboxylesterase